MKTLTEYVDHFGMPLQEKEDDEMLLPKDLIMIDCEMSGVVPERDSLLQVAMLHLKLEGKQYQVTGDPLVQYYPYDGEPENGFQKKYLSEIIKKCNESTLTDEEARSQIEGFLGNLKGKVTPVGDCVPTDMAFLYARGVIDRPDIKDDKQVPGTFHFEFFDLNSVKAIARQKAGKKFKVPGLDDGIHDALVDCQNQTKELNEYLKILL